MSSSRDEGDEASKPSPDNGSGDDAAGTASVDLPDVGDVAYADIGVNLTDPVFTGIYHGKRAHESDLEDVIQRAESVGCRALMITGSDLQESKKAVELARKYHHICKATIGIHPCSSQIFGTHPGGTEGVLAELTALVKSCTTDTTSSSTSTQSNAQSASPLAALGELGLDYDRLQHSPKTTQLHAFKSQLTHITTVLFPYPSPSSLSSPTNTLTDPPTSTPPPPPPPLFLHSRAAHTDFLTTLRPFLPHLPRRGVVHSFTGTVDEMNELLDAGFDIGVNGCSVRASEGLEVVRHLPLDRMHLETDAPWCEIRPSSAGRHFLEESRKTRRGEGEEEGEGGREERWKSVKKEKWVKGCLVKGRNEPCKIGEVAEIVAAVKGVGVEVVRREAWGNWRRMFGEG